MTETVSEKLSDWLVGLTPSLIPEEATIGVLDTVIDTIGLAYAARDTDYMTALVNGWETGPGRSTLFGHGKSVDTIGAAMINGTAAHGEDFDNSYEGCPVHSGTVVVPAVFAIGESRGLSGAATFTGIAAGIEIMCRMGQITGTGVHKAGFHPTAVIGAMAAAAGVGVALGLDRVKLTNAFGLAGSMAAGIIEYLADGSWTKRMHAGWAAQAGIRAATMAASGFIGPKTVFEGDHGFYFAFAPSIKPDFELLTSNLGKRWETSNLSFKPYACGTMCQPFVDCALQLRSEGIKSEAIDSLTCRVGEGTVHRLWAPLSLKQRPPTGYGAKFSGPYCIAVALIDGDAGLAQFTDERIVDRDLLALTEKITFEIDPENEYPKNYTGEIIGVLTNGRTVRAFQPHLRGGKNAPLTHSDLVRKYFANLDFGRMDERAAQRLLRSLEQLPELEDLKIIGELLLN
jgi:2-methylcitrate dehydratase PrpD